MKRTVENLAKAFVGESQARNRYTFYAKIAKKEGFEHISAIFSETAEHEREHASQIFKMIDAIKKDSVDNLDELEITTQCPTIYGDTIANLESAIHGEHHEHTEMYPEFAKIAEMEGFVEIAEKLRAIAKAEEYHEERYKRILQELKMGTIFIKKEEEVEWVCRKCGYVNLGHEPPNRCPSCGHAKNYYQLKCDCF